MSLYLVAGLPLIVWNKMGAAQYIKTHNLGIEINSLDEISDKIAHISEDTLSNIHASVYDIGRKVSTGYFYRKAIEKCLKIIEMKRDKSIDCSSDFRKG